MTQFKIFFRQLYKSGLHAFYKLTGITLGLAVAFLSVVYVAGELGHDPQVSDTGQVFRLNRIVNTSGEEEEMAMTHGRLVKSTHWSE